MGLLVSGIVLVLIFRVPLLQWGLTQAAVRAGVPAFSVEVKEVGWRRIELASLTLGQTKEIAVEHLVFSYDPWELLQGGDLKIAARGLNALLDLSGDAPVLGSLSPLLSGDTGSREPMALLPFRPQLTLESGRLRLRGDWGLAHLPFEAEFFGRSLEQAQGWISFTGGEVEGRAPERFSAELLFTLSDLQARWDIDWAELAVESRGEVDLRFKGRALAWQLDSGFDLAVPRGLLGAAAEQFERVEARGEVSGSGTLPFAHNGGDWRALQNWSPDQFDAARAALRSEVQITAWHQKGAVVGAALPIQANLKDQELVLSFADEGQVEVTKPLSLMDGGEAYLGLVGERLSLRLPATGNRARIVLTLTDVIPVDAELAVEMTGTAAQRVSFRGRVSTDLNTPKPRPLTTLSNLDLQVEQFHWREWSFDRFSARGGAIPRADGWLADLALALEGLSGKAGEIAVADGAVDVEGRLSLARDRVEVTSQAGKARVAKAAHAGVGHLTAPLTLDLSPGQLLLRIPETGEEPIIDALRLPLAYAPTALHLNDGDQEIKLSGGGATLFREERGDWHLELSEKGAELPARQAMVQNLKARLLIPEQAALTPLGLPQVVPELKLSGDLSGSAFSTAATPHFPSLAFDAKGKGSLADMALEGRATFAEGVDLLHIKGQHDVLAGRGKFDLVVPEIAMVPGGVQPENFNPSLADLQVDVGTLSGHAELAVDGGQADGHGYLNVDLTQADYAGTAIEALSARIFFQGLEPVTLPPGQKLTIGKLDVGVPIRDVDVLFGVELGAEPTMDLRRATLALAGGLFSLKPAVFPLLSEERHLTLKVEELSVEELFTLAGQPELSGTGSLSGQIPVVFEGDKIAVTGGRLAATGPGVLRIKSQTVAEALAGGGEQVELLIRALEDFHYSELTLELDKPLDGAAEARLGITGANPAVLDGYPFRLNVNLETKVEPLLEALLAGRQLSQGLISDLLGR